MSFDQLVYETFSDFKFANEYNILALAVLLDRPLYVYTDKQDYHHNYSLNEKHSRNLPLMILQVNGNHFMPLMAHSEASTAIPPRRNQFKSFFSFSALDSLDLYEH